MQLGRGLLALTLALLGATVCAPRSAFAADDNDLEADDEPAKDDKGKDKDATKDPSGFGTYTPPIQTVKGHAYTLQECLALADRNFPNLWAARARLAFVHAQLDEA